jgi:hypothetical protein
VPFFPGIFDILGYISSSSLTNSTFTNLTGSIRGGGAMFINNPNIVLIDCCVFTQCKAVYGGALYLDPIPYINITHTRFENNSASLSGSDIHVVTYPCFNDVLSGSLASSVCSTTPLGNRLTGWTSYAVVLYQLLNTCAKEVV